MARVVATVDQPLIVVSHGAKEANVGLPYFNRVSSLMKTDRSFIIVSDPTLGVDETLALAWYEGTLDTDPLDAIEALVRRVSADWGIRQVLFQGSSGGGFSSLRLAARFPDSVALVFSPQTDPFMYEGGRFARILSERTFGGRSREELERQFPGRFSMPKLYAGLESPPFVYYVQNSGDKSHIKDHLEPFLEANGLDVLSTIDKNARVHLALVEQGPGHIRPTLDMWNEHEALALEMMANVPGAMHESTGISPGDVSKVSYEVLTEDNQTVPLHSIKLEGRLEFRAKDLTDFSADFRSSPSPDLLRVFFHGAINREHGMAGALDSRIEPSERVADLHVIDPFVSRSLEVGVAWYAGGANQALMRDLSQLIKEMAQVLGTTKVLAVGSSAGGFAALQLAAESDDIAALVFSPDLSIRRFAKRHRDAFLREAGFDLDHEGSFALERRLNLVYRLASRKGRLHPATRVFLNADDTDYATEQTAYLCYATHRIDAVSGWRQLGLDAAFIPFDTSIRKPAWGVLSRHLEEATQTMLSRTNDPAAPVHEIDDGERTAGDLELSVPLNLNDVKVIAYTRLGIGVFDPEWWNIRLSLFEAITLPSISQHVRPGFTWVIFLDTEVPEVHLERLKKSVRNSALSDHVTFHFLDFISDYRSGFVSACRNILARDEFAIFHAIDDDDAISVDFYSNMWKVICSHSQAKRQIVTAPIFYDYNPEFNLVSPSTFGFYTFNTVYYGTYHDVEPILEVSHESRGKWAEENGFIVTSLTDSDKPSGLYTQHGLADTDYPSRVRRLKENPGTVDCTESIAARFGISLPLIEVWSERQSSIPFIHGTTWNKPGPILGKARQSSLARRTLKEELRKSMASVVETEVPLDAAGTEFAVSCRPAPTVSLVNVAAGQVLSSGPNTLYGSAPANVGVEIWLNGKIYRKVRSTETGFWSVQISFGISPNWRLAALRSGDSSPAPEDVEVTFAVA